jgi:uncharacterized protein YndB with AHSA1/START domain
VEQTAAVAAPAESVWAALVDVEQWPTWTRSMQKVTRLDDGPLEVGSKVRIKQPRFMPVLWRVTELDPGRSFTWSTATPGQTAVATHTVRPMGAGTSEVCLTFDQSGALSPMLGVLFRGVTRRYVRMEAEGLARYVSGSAE